MITAKGKIQRLKASDISTIGRNTQGVRVIRLDKGDSLVSCAVIAGDIVEEQMAAALETSSEPPVSTESEAPQPDATDLQSDQQT